MYTIIYDLYFSLKRKQKKQREEGKTTSKIIQKIIDRIEWFYNVPVRNWYVKHPSKKWCLNKKPREEKIIVSLTSYPKRIGTIWFTIETIFRQTVKPDQVILWLAKTQFEDMDSLPDKLLHMRKKGLTIRFCDDLRSHKKYYYVMQEYPKDIIVLMDDDMIYPKDTIERLLQMHKKHPKDICTMTAQVIRPSFKDKPSLWTNPKLQEKFEHSDKIQIFTGSGSLYPPGTLDKSVFDLNLIKSLCPSADDLWLTFMAYRKGTKITSRYPWRAFPITIYGTSEGSLWYLNCEKGANDVQWDLMLKYFYEEK